MFKGFKAVSVVCGVVACKDNGKVGGCGDGCIADSGGCKVVVGVWGLGFCVVDRWRGWEVRQLPRGLYPDKNHSFLIPF